VSLMKPPRGRLGLEAAQEQAVDIQILEKLNKLEDGQDYLKVAMLGGTYQEIIHPGRLPLLEKQIELVNGRIKLLEDEREQRKTMIRTAVLIATFEGSVIGALLTLAVEFFRHR
jgi:hypothetical protein